MKKYFKKCITLSLLASMMLPSTLASAAVDRTKPVISQLNANSAVVSTASDARLSYKLSEKSRVSIVVYKNNKRYQPAFYGVTKNSGLNTWIWKGPKKEGIYNIKVFAIDQRGNYATPKNVYVKIVKNTIKSVSPVANINVPYGGTVKLPTTVKVTYLSSKTALNTVVWGAVNNKKTGVQTIYGTVAGTTIKAKVNVIVGAEKIAPTITGTVYDKTNNTITVSFSEKVKFTNDAVSGAAITLNQVLADKFVIRNRTTGQFVTLTGTTVTLPVSGETLAAGVTKVTVKLAAAPEAGEYSVALKTTTIKDLVGNLFNDIYSNKRDFTVADTKAPTITGTVYDETNKTITVTFSEGVKFTDDANADEAITTEQALADKFVIRNRTTGQFVTLTGTTVTLQENGESLANGVTKVVVQLADAPAAGEYSVALKTTTIKDVAGNVFDDTYSNKRDFTVVAVTEALQGYSVKVGDTILSDNATAFLNAVAANEGSTYDAKNNVFVGSPTTDSYGRTSGLELSTTAPSKARTAPESYVTITDGSTTYYVTFNSSRTPFDGRTSKYLTAIDSNAGYTGTASIAGVTGYEFDYYFGQDKVALQGYSVKVGDTILSDNAAAFLNAVAANDGSTYDAANNVFVGSPTTDSYGRTSGLVLSTTAPSKARTAPESYVSITDGSTTYYVTFNSSRTPFDGRTSKYLTAIDSNAGYTGTASIAGVTGYEFDYYFGQDKVVE